jgi:peptidyl-prolyl cis-trans isomerase A (cyclophilin A)
VQARFSTFVPLLLVGCGTRPAPTVEPRASAPAAPASTAGQVPREEPGVSAKGPFPESKDPALRDSSRAAEKAPATFRVAFATTAGDFRVECTREWAPHGVDRFYNLVKIGFFDDVAFFRVVKEPRPFVVQFGIHGNPEVSKVWRFARLPADEPKQSNIRGTLTYAMAGPPTTRTTQLFINFSANTALDQMGFSPICRVPEEDMKVVEAIEGAYGEEPSSEQEAIESQGNAFLRSRYPFLDYIKTARLAP